MWYSQGTCAIGITPVENCDATVPRERRQGLFFLCLFNQKNKVWRIFQDRWENQHQSYTADDTLTVNNKERGCDVITQTKSQQPNASVKIGKRNSLASGITILHPWPVISKKFCLLGLLSVSLGISGPLLGCVWACCGPLATIWIDIYKKATWLIRVTWRHFTSYLKGFIIWVILLNKSSQSYMTALLSICVIFTTAAVKPTEAENAGLYRELPLHGESHRVIYVLKHTGWIHYTC